MPKGHSAKSSGTIDGTMAQRILDELRKKPTITMDQLSVEVNIPRRTLVRYMDILREEGRIERIGSKRYGHWQVRD